ncbi:DMT family transporter, partial [Actinophytocola xanthii]
LAWFGRLHPLTDPAVRWRVLVTGALLAEFQAAYQVALAWISVSLATLVTIGSVPVLVAAVTAVRDRQWPTLPTLVPVAVSLAGLALLSGASAEGWGAAAGIGMSLLAGAGFATLTLVTARSVGHHGAVTAAGLLLGGLLLTPFALVAGMSVPFSGSVLGLVVFIGVVPTAVAYGVYALGARTAGASSAALAAMLEPLTATLLAVGLRGERLSLAGIAGAVLVAAALVWGAAAVNRPGRPRASRSRARTSPPVRAR